MPFQALTTEDLAAAIAPLLERIELLEAAVPNRMTTEQACTFLNCDASTLYRMRQRGEVKAEKDGRTVHYDRNSLIEHRRKKGLSPLPITHQLSIAS